jgi:hypothetical protein
MEDIKTGEPYEPTVNFNNILPFYSKVHGEALGNAPEQKTLLHHINNLVEWQVLRDGSYKYWAQYSGYSTRSKLRNQWVHESKIEDTDLIQIYNRANPMETP